MTNRDTDASKETTNTRNTNCRLWEPKSGCLWHAKYVLWCQQKKPIWSKETKPPEKWPSPHPKRSKGKDEIQRLKARNTSTSHRRLESELKESLVNRDQAEYHYRLHTAARDTPPREQPELTLLHRRWVEPPRRRRRPQIHPIKTQYHRQKNPRTSASRDEEAFHHLPTSSTKTNSDRSETWNAICSPIQKSRLLQQNLFHSTVCWLQRRSIRRQSRLSSRGVDRSGDARPTRISHKTIGDPLPFTISFLLLPFFLNIFHERHFNSHLNY